MNKEFHEVYATLNDNDYDYSNSVIEDIVHRSKAVKGDLIAMLRQMPNWDEESQALVFKEDIVRSIDAVAADEALNWLLRSAAEACEEIKYPCFGYYEVRRIISRLEEKISTLNTALSNGEEFVRWRAEELRREIEHFYKIRNWYLERTTEYPYDCEKRISNEDAEKLNHLKRVVRYMNRRLSQNESTLDEQTADLINEYFPMKKRVVAGFSLSKTYGRLATYFKVNTIEDWQTKHNGELKNYGYNYQIAKFGDATNPFTVPRIVTISVNVADFLNMSNGDSWASCHTIRRDGFGGYNGEYSSGTISYALDPCSFIFSTIDSEYDGDEYSLQPKMQRCVFAYKDGALYQGRVYPDGRDGGDQGYAAQFRAIVQKLFADVEGKSNFWVKLDKDVIENLGGTAYHDWYHYSDTNVTGIKEMVEGKSVRISINQVPVCIECGCSHHETECISCCESGCHCDRCGDHVSRDDAEYIGDNVYCCAECAEHDGWRWCYNVDEWCHINDSDVHYDSYENEWFYDNGDAVRTEDNNWYMDCDNASKAGYMETEDGEWYPSDEVYRDTYTGEYFHAEDESDYVEINGNIYQTIDNAIANGENIPSEENEESEVA